MEYKCDLCGAPATVHITKIVNGQKIKMHLCQSCAEKNAEMCSAGFPPDIIPNIKKLEEKILEAIPHAKKASRLEVKCPTCHTTLSEFEKNGRFSCPDCYKAFGKKVIELLAQMHGAIKHVGKSPLPESKTVKKSNRKGDATNSNQIEFDLGDIMLSSQIENGDSFESEFLKMANETFKDLGFGKIKVETSKLVPAEESGAESIKPLSKEKLLKNLQEELEKAIKDERYEDAAKFRDEINSLEKDS